MLCECCGGKGKILSTVYGWIPCPKCGVIKVTEDNSTSAPVISEEVNNEVKEAYTALEVPEMYQLMKYSSDLVFFSKVGNMFQMETLKSLASVCDKIYSSIYYGEILLQSVYLHFPPVLDGNIFVFDTQKLALSRGFTVSRYATLNELVDIIGTDEYKIFYTSQICFLDASAKTTETGWVALADLLAIRARKGLATYVTGYWGSTQIMNRSGAKYILDNDGDRLSLLKPYELVSKRSKKAVNPYESLSESVNNDSEDTLKYL